MRSVFIFGTGGHAREVGDIARALALRPIFVAASDAEIAAWTWPDDVVSEAGIDGLTGESYAIGVGDNHARKRVAARHSSLDFANLIHPDASFGHGQRALIEARVGNVVFAGVRFTVDITVGDFCVFNLNATVSHDCEIGNFVTLAPGASLAGNVRVEDGAWIGMGAAVNQGQPDVKRIIGAETVIGSGAVVTRNCDPGDVYVGVPAKKIG